MTTCPDSPGLYAEFWDVAERSMPAAWAIIRSPQILNASVRLRKATAEEDMRQATDAVLEVVAANWAIRCRDDCRDTTRDFTLCLTNPSGAKAEYEKIVVDGHAHRYLFGWRGFTEWMIVDLDRFRSHPLCRQGSGPLLNRKTGETFLYWECERLHAAGLLVAYDIRRLPMLH